MIQTPDGISLLMNLKSFVIASYSEVTFTLSCGGATIVTETYRPDSGGQIEIQARDIIGRHLSTTLPTSDQYTQADAVKTFVAKVDGSTVATFTVVAAGVRHMAVSPTEFLQSNWLTWQPQSKQVTWSSPEYLSYYFVSAASVRAKFYLLDGSTTIITVATGTAGQLQTFSMAISRLFSLANLTPEDAYGVVDVWVETAGGAQLSYVQRYICADTQGDEHAYLAVNSLGGIDTYIFHGECSDAPEVEHDSAEREDARIDTTSKIARKWRQSTGYFGLDEARWFFELVASRKAWAVINGNAEAIIIDADSAEVSDRENTQEGSFAYQLAEEGRLLNISRISGQLPTLQVPSPDGAIFFLEARLIDYPDADLSETLLFLLQTPYSDNWKKASLAALVDRIYSLILASPVGQLVHTHDNGTTLAGLSEASDHLAYNGRSLAFLDEIAATFPALEWVEPIIDAESGLTVGMKTLYPLTVNGSVKALGDVIAYWESDEEAEGEISPAAYDRLDPVNDTWPAYDATKAGWILSAALGWNLQDRLASAESAATTLEGRVTALEQSSGGGSSGGADHSHANLAVLNGITAEAVASWNGVAALFSATSNDGSVTGINALYPLSVAGDITATGDIVAYGTASGASAPAAYDRLDPVDGSWPAYDATKAGWILSAALGWNLQDRLASAESAATTLEGRVTALEQSSGGGSSGGADHSHANLAVLNGITAEAVASWTGVAALFEAITSDGAVTGINALHPLSVTGGITATGDVVAYGSASGASAPTAYDRLDPVSDAWPAYDATKAGWILSAALGWDLQERVTTLEQSGGSGGGAGHSHANLAVLNTITAEAVASWNGMAALFSATSSEGTVTGINALHPLSVTGGITATGDVVAYGSASGASAPTAYDRLDPVSDAWPAYDATKAGWILSAALGWDLEERVSTLEQSSGGGSGHTHTNLSLLEAITAERMAAWDAGGGSGSGETGHTHTNLAALNNITQTKIDSWDGAASAAHSHSNKTVLDGITAQLVNRWNSAWANIGIANYDTNNKLLATRDWVSQQGFLTAHQSLTGYATQEWVSQQGFLTSHQSLDGYAKTTDLHSHSNKTVLDGITSTKVSHWDDAYSGLHSHSNKTVLDGITSTKVNSWDAAAEGSWLPLSGGTLTGALAGTTLAMRTGTFGDTSNAGSVSIVRKISSRTYTATVSIDSSGNIVITPTSTGIIICAGTVKASGDVLGYT